MLTKLGVFEVVLVYLHRTTFEVVRRQKNLPVRPTSTDEKFISPIDEQTIVVGVENPIVITMGQNADVKVANRLIYLQLRILLGKEKGRQS